MTERSKARGVLLLLLTATAVFPIHVDARAGSTMFHYPEQLAPLGLDPLGSGGWSVSLATIRPAGGVVYPGETVSVEITVRNAGASRLDVVPVIEVVRIGCRFEREDAKRDDPMARGQVFATVPLSQPRRFPAPALAAAPGKEGTIRWQQEKATDLAEFGAYAVIVELPGDASPLEASVIADWPGLCSQWSAAGKKKARSPSLRIWELFPPDIQSIVADAAGGAALDDARKAKVIDALNAALGRRDLFRRSDFPDIALSDEGKELLKMSEQEPSPAEIRRFNRLLLDASYPKRVVKSRPKLRQAVATLARVHPPNPAGGDGRNSPLIYRLHPRPHLGQQLETIRRLGYTWVHAGSMPNWAGVSQTDVGAPFDWGKADQWIEPFRKNALFILSNLQGSPRQTITDANWQADNHVHDPKHDARFGDFVEEAVRRYCGDDGKGPLQIIDFWDQPWEGGGPSGWKSDAARYRALYRIVYERAHKGSRRIAVGGASRIMNTLDKFATLSRGEPQWAQQFDILTDHDVQPYACFGPRIGQKLALSSIETGTWLASSPETLIAAATHFTAAGQAKVSPHHPAQLLWENGPAGPLCRPEAAAASFFLHFLAGLSFERIVSHDHLPWVYQWGGPQRVAFILAGDRHRLDTSAVTLYDQIRANGRISIDAMDGKLKAYDLYGNPYPAVDGKYDLPCSEASVYLEAPGIDPKIVTQTIVEGRMADVKPVEFFVDDFVKPLARGGTLDVEVHNVLNRRINGTVAVEGLLGLSLARGKVAVSLSAGARTTLRFAIEEFRARRTNAYPFTFRFEGQAGTADWRETLSVNTIAYGRPTIDGDLADWADAIPVFVHDHGRDIDLTEAVLRIEDQLKDVPRGFASVRFKWDEDHLYVGVRNKTKEWGPKPRLSTRKDEAYVGTGDLAHTYIKTIDDALPFTGHCFQLGVRFAPLRFRLPAYGVVPPQMLAADDTDYEYAIWRTPDGAAEIWRSTSPDLGFFNFLPWCMPKGYDGVAQGAEAVVKREENDTIYEIAIPLADLKDFRPAPGTVVHLTFALPGSGIQFGVGRSRTRANGLTLKPTWQAHPSNDIRWGFLERK